MRLRALTSTVLVAVLLPAGGILEAQQRTIRCESSSNRQNFCRVNTDGRATLVREFSRSRCTQWRTWGFERGGVWVRDGCRADFRVGRPGSSGGVGAGTAAVVGAGVGAAVMAAILSNRESGSAPAPAPPPPPRTPPSWAVGTFRGFDPRDNIELDITVTPQGDIAGTADGKTIGGGMTVGGIRIGTAEFGITQEAWGFTARSRDSTNTLIYFRRLVDGQ
jgi:hypothetical protein